MGTKTPKSMYELAKAQAFANDILLYEDRTNSITYVGYLLPRKSLYNLFRMQGFTRMPTIEKYIELWSDLNWIKIIGNHIFFYPNENDMDQYDNLIASREDSRKNPDHMNDVYIIGGASA